MSTKELYSSPQITRAYELIQVLAGHEFNPLTPKQIKQATGWNGVTVTRHCQAAIAAGFVEATPDNKYRLKRGTFTNIALAVQSGIQRAQSRMNDETNNFTRSPY